MLTNTDPTADVLNRLLAGVHPIVAAAARETWPTRPDHTVCVISAKPTIVSVLHERAGFTRGGPLTPPPTWI